MFARRLPDGRRYGVVAGTGRLSMRWPTSASATRLAAVGEFLDGETLQWLADYRFTGDIDGYREGELYFPGSLSSPCAHPSPTRWCSNADPVDPQP